MPTTRVIDDIQQTSLGVVARSNDGRAYLLVKGQRKADDLSVVEPDVWLPLPALPQEDYVDPVPNMFSQLGNGFQGLHQMMESLHPHGPQNRRVGGTETCPVDGCGFTGSLADVTSHMQMGHDPEEVPR